MSTLTSNQLTFVDLTDQVGSCTVTGAQVFKYNASGTLVGDTQITLTGTVENVTISKWQYWNWNAATPVYADYPTTVDNPDITSSTLIVKPAHAVFNSAGVAQIKLSTSNADVYDTITITKIYDGHVGIDAYTILLTNESHTFAGTTDAAVASNTTTQIYAYKGATEQNVTITKVNNVNATTTQTNTGITGLQFKVSSTNATVHPTITFYTLTTLTIQSGVIPITMTVDGQTFTKNFSWSVARTGSGACSLSITASSQIFKSSDAQTYTPSSITLTPVVQNLALSNCAWTYSTNGGQTYNNITSGVATVDSTTKILTLSNASAAFSSNITSLVFKCANGDYIDTMTVSKLTDGQSAAAAYTAILSNEMQNIPTDVNLKPLSSTTYSCNVVVYKGTTQLTATNSSTVSEGYFKVGLPSNPTGITLSQSTAGVVTFSVNTNTAISASGNIDLSINVEGQSTVTKSISYAVSKSGAPGTPGTSTYSAQFSQDYIALDCNSSGSTTASKSVTINFGTYCGNTRIGTSSCVLNNLPTGVTAGTPTQATTSSDGSVTITIAQGTSLSGAMSGTFKISLTTTDSHYFERYITLIKTVPGAQGSQGSPGTSAITFTVYSPNGDTFTDDITEITMNTYAYNGITAITSCNYLWSAYNSTNNTWVDNFIQNSDGTYSGCTASSLTISRAAVTNVQTFRCRMEYPINSSVYYYAYYTLEDTTDIYLSEIRTIGGTVLNANKPYTIAYVSISKNGEEIDALVGEIWASTTANPSTAGNYYKIENNTIVLKYFNGSSWTTATASQVYQYNWSGIQSNNTISNFNLSTKVVLLNSNHISNSVTVECSISSNQNVSISKCQLSFVDLNDPVVSTVAPSNPTAGQLWVDISTTPYVIKVYNGTSWEVIRAYDGTAAKIFTSKPDSILTDGCCYKVGDMWVVGEDYQPFIYDESSGSLSATQRYLQNTILVCVEARNSYSDIDWRDANNISTLRDSLSSYQEVMKVFDDGLYLFGKSNNDDRASFYSQLSSGELAFYQRDPDAIPSQLSDLDGKRGTKIIWIGDKSFHARDAEIEGSLKVTSSTTTSNPFIQIGNLKIQQENNGSYSIIVVA